MAQNTAVRLTDDISGEPAEETISFALYGVEYEIDLSGRNARRLREILEPFVSHGRRTGGRKRAPRVIQQPKSAKKTPARLKAAAPAVEPKPTVRRKAAPPKETAAAPVTKRRAATPAKAASKAAAKATSKAAPKPAPAKAAAPAKEPVVPPKPTRRAVRKAPPVTFSAAQ